MFRLVKNVPKVLRLSPAELVLVLKVSSLLCVLWIVERRLALPRLVRIFEPKSRKHPRLGRDRVIELTKQVLRVNVGALRPNCMKQSLVLYHVLRQSGDPVRIHFGISKKDDKLDGHCWLDLEDQPIAEPADPREAFNVVYSFP